MDTCSAIMVTRNRCAEVCGAIESILEQDVCDDLVVVVDASEDDTVAVLQARFPQARLFVNTERKGVSYCRTLAIREARHEHILQIDDDAVLTSGDIAAETLKYFSDERIAAVTIPYININQSSEVHHQSPEGAGIYVAYTYTGTAIVLRRSIFLAMGGYSLELEHWGEERDYALRLLNAGYVVVYGRAKPVHHLVSSSRDQVYQNIYLYRNQLFFNYLRAPLVYLPFLFAWAFAWSLRNALRSRTSRLAVRGLWRGICACFEHRKARAPMTLSRYRLALDLRKRGGLPFNEVITRMESHG